MKKQRNSKFTIDFFKEKYYSAPHIWYSFLNIIASALIYLILCLGLFIWLEGNMKEEDYERCERAHERLQEIESRCNEQIRDIYKDSQLQADFWLFWNNTMAAYMEKRIQEHGISDSIKSFPEYMNVFITEHQDVFYKIYFITNSDVYTLSARPEGGGGVYDYNIPYSTYVEEISSDATGYPISVNVQDINDMKTNRGTMIFLVDYDYLFGNLKHPYNDYVLLKHGSINKFWGDVSRKKESPDFNTYWSIYQCENHGNEIEIGFRMSDVMRKNSLAFFLLTCAVVAVTGIMLVWIWRIAQNSARFLDAFIHTIQLAKKGEFKQIEVGGRKDTYAMLADEINDMIENLDILIKKEYLLKINQQQIEMKAMLYQINPHFLYNTLEIIRAQSNIQGNVEVSDALFDLGSMYRMLSKLNDTIPLRQEIDLLRHYLNILELGNQDNFYYEIDVDPELMELDTVKFWMQPLAENYFVHGYDREKEYNLFSVQGQLQDGIYQILIMDNGIGMEESEIEKLNQELAHQEGLPKENIGVRNVCQRLKYFYRNRMTFRISKNEPKGTCIEICIEQGWNRE